MYVLYLFSAICSHIFTKPTFRKDCYHETNQQVRLSLNKISPVWEFSKEFLVTSKPKAVISVKLFDERGLAVDPSLGIISIRLPDIMTKNESKEDWFPLAQTKSGRVRMTAQWKAVAMTGSISGAGGYSPVCKRF